MGDHRACTEAYALAALRAGIPYFFAETAADELGHARGAQRNMCCKMTKRTALKEAVLKTAAGVHGPDRALLYAHISGAFAHRFFRWHTPSLTAANCAAAPHYSSAVGEARSRVAQERGGAAEGRGEDSQVSFRLSRVSVSCR
jgi:hypothetical protein